MRASLLLGLAEAYVIEAYRFIAPADYVCTALQNTTLTIQPDSSAGWWDSKELGPVRGLAFKGSRMMVLADVPVTTGAYPHEVGHFIDYAMGIPGDPNDHYEWKARGFCAAHVEFWNHFGTPTLAGKACL
jgi:hypothetical protein